MKDSRIELAPVSIASRHFAIVCMVFTGAVAICIALLTLRPTAPLPYDIYVNDKIAHTLVFVILVLPAAAFWPCVSVSVAWLAVLYGGAIELIQSFIGRQADLSDLLADAVGVGLALTLGKVFRCFLEYFNRREPAITANLPR